MDLTIQYITRNINYYWYYEINKIHKIPLNVFIRHIIKESRTNEIILKIAIIYLLRIKDKIDINDESQCGRRMFLIALILATKYWNDYYYTNKAWSKISGLPTEEIFNLEFLFLEKIDYKLHFSSNEYKSISNNIK